MAGREPRRPLGSLALATVGMWFIGAIVTSKVVVLGGGIRVDNWFTRYWIPWSAVAEIEVDPAVAVVLRDETVVPLGVGGASVLNALRGNRYQRRVRERIEAARAAAPVASPADSVMTRSWRLLLWAAVYFGLASPHLIAG
ncbi:PH (Pleckstrin Homology) domain-containing protein [Prauserella shujinwangii]|uniref:PH (Pleckstrin Homology) domain-containing protein n=1 Tax=Prauserella shujinwangii TaxID=1453103 RepID=A0A2T0LLF1_9PSEU|nr:PH domain-containing protein [Prauserella shujinwangii]PRX43862.1 PH (Pleckstrin Homology) domain-containing protein [Prauserella shujinwangii]